MPPENVAFEHAVHGRTMGSLSVTWDDHYRAPFAPLLQDVVWVPAGDEAALAVTASGDTTWASSESESPSEPVRSTATA